MKFRVQMKDPDTLHDAISEAVVEDVAKLHLDAEESELLVEKRSRDAAAVAEQWFEYGEYLTVEIDTDAKTCTVVPARTLR